MANDIKFEIIQHICMLSDRNNGWRKECNLVRWNDGVPKVDIREWSYDRSSMSKGVTLTKQEYLTLYRSLRYVRVREWDKYEESGNKPAVEPEQVDDRIPDEACQENIEAEKPENVIELPAEEISEECTKEKIASGM